MPYLFALFVNHNLTINYGCIEHETDIETLYTTLCSTSRVPCFSSLIPILTRVTRDRYGDFVSTLYPYLIERSGFEAIERDEPGPVFACWNGILVARGEPFLPPRLRPIGSMSILSNVSLPNVSTSEPLGRGLPTSHPIYGTPDAGKPPREMPALKFRASGPDECFSSVRVRGT